MCIALMQLGEGGQAVRTHELKKSCPAVRFWSGAAAATDSNRYLPFGADHLPRISLTTLPLLLSLLYEVASCRAASA
jgi:hypothetical protein